ncbi:carbohydrate sulfotransferase 6-like [Bufo bufo]|uniref:carbohydrate sulfotransferase 6-like n=1 Tax=Bufo bufo TaxID=8384 RepID=UPI001ABEBC6D|nr:carbohydrate sulfotransferase 6-like [Bufo bufo]XP_040261718.1 carbohydrate sulfotransferase 6-like [Bufo bufo]
MSLRLPFIFFLFFMSFSLLYVFHFLSSKSPSCYTSTFKARRVHVLLLSSWRSGSSFLGQIFNHHKDVFYIYEPGHAVWMKLQGESSELLHYPLRDVLHSLFNCDVTPFRHYLPKEGKYINDMRFFAESQALCIPPACSSFIPSEGYDRKTCLHRCVNNSMDRAEEACQMYSHVVMKTVRILDLSTIFPLLEDPYLNLRIIHLVRDPRAVALSRKGFPLITDDHILLKNEGISKDKNYTISNVMAKTCKAQVDITRLARTSKSLNGRYMVIRHEDLAKNPVESARKMFDFAELELTEHMKKWIYKITHVEVREGSDFLTFSRVSSKVIEKWRTAADFNFVHQIQLMCKGAMREFGYFPVRSRKAQLDKSVEVLMTNWSQTEG